MRAFLLLLSTLLAACSTPITGGETLAGGATDRQLSDTTYVVTAQLNGFTAAAALKPAILRRAKLIAQANGFEAFEIQTFSVSYDGRGEGYSSDAVLRFSRERETPIAGRRYLLNSEHPSPYKEKLDPSDVASLAKVSGFRHKDSTGTFVRLEPAFIDAVSSERNGWTTDVSTTYVRPGLQDFAAYVVVQQGFLGPAGRTLVPVRAVFAPNTSYSMVGRFVDGQLEYWIEENSSKQATNPTERRSVMLR